MILPQLSENYNSFNANFRKTDTDARPNACKDIKYPPRLSDAAGCGNADHAFSNAIPKKL